MRLLSTMQSFRSTYFVPFLQENASTLAIGLVVSFLVALWLKTKSKPRTKKRSFSFTSEGMVHGVFPSHVQAPESIINASLFFQDCPSSKDLVEKVVKPMLEYERLNSIPEPNNASTPLRPCPPFDEFDLVRRITIAGGGSDEDIYDEIFRHLQDPLSENRNGLPWWELLVIENQQKGQGEGHSAVVLRIHHGLADGISLVNVFGKFITYEDGSPVKSFLTFVQQQSKPKKQQQQQKRGGGLFQTIWSLLRETIYVLTLGATAYDDDTVFSRSAHGNMIHTNNRSYVILPATELDFVKELKNAANVTVNDILMTAMSHAIHDYCASQNCPVLASDKPIQCRALLPVAFPRPQEELDDPSLALRNKWCLVSTDLGVGCKDIMERLHFIHAKTQDIKSTPRAYMQLLIQNTIPPLLPLSVGRQTVYDVFCRHSMVFSNVPGPDRPCLLAGKVCTSVQMFYGNLIPQIGLLSYAGMVHGNMVLDPDAIPDASSIARLYALALVQLADRLHVVPPASLVNHAAAVSKEEK